MRTGLPTQTTSMMMKGTSVFALMLIVLTALITVAKAQPQQPHRRHLDVYNKKNNDNDDTEVGGSAQLVLVNKCCEKFEIFDEFVCQQVNETDFLQPIFSKDDGIQNVSVKYKFVIGLPNCGSMQMWSVLHYKGSQDKLVLLTDGRLRHFTNANNKQREVEGIVFNVDADNEDRNLFQDYKQNHYCLDRAISSTKADRNMLFARICLDKREVQWNDSGFLVRKILNPLFHGIGLIMLLMIAIVYFVLPTLRDLVGNIVTTISVCLMFAQAADLVRIFTELTNHVSFIVSDIVLFVSMLGAFFWLNSLGYYIWKTFRSRNVFLRVTDGKKYCYYSLYAWGCTSLLAGTALFAHFFLDADPYRKQVMIADQETIGWLGMAIFFTPVAFTIIVNIFFYVTTLKLINRRNVYGRIQLKLKENFTMFALMLAVMSISWLFLMLSWIQGESVLYAHVVVNALQSPLLLYICVLRQNHVTFLLKKSCCYNEPPSTSDWGDELHYMNSNDY